MQKGWKNTLMQIGAGKPFLPQELQVEGVQAGMSWALQVDVHETQRSRCTWGDVVCFQASSMHFIK